MSNINIFFVVAEYIIILLLLILFIEGAQIIKIDIQFLRNKKRRKIFVIPSILMATILLGYVTENIYQIFRSIPKRQTLTQELGPGNNFVLICSQLIPDKFVRKIRLASNYPPKVRATGFENAGIPNSVIEDIINKTLPKGFKINCGYGIEYIDLYNPMPKDYGYNIDATTLPMTAEKNQVLFTKQLRQMDYI